MAILARAAALNDISADEDAKKDTAENNEDGMKEINDMMKCAAMLLFHVVFGSSGEMNEEATTKNDVVSSEETGTVVGYDGRVRHVMKLACVDILSRAILEAVESFDNDNVSIEKDKREQCSGPYDMDEYSLWNIANIKTFLDQTDLGKDAVFGTPFKQSSGRIGNVGMEMLLEADDENKSEKQEKGRSQSEVDEQTVASLDSSKQSQQSDAGEQISSCGEMPPNTVESIPSMDSFLSSCLLEVQSEEVKEQVTPSVENSLKKEVYLMI